MQRDHSKSKRPIPTLSPAPLSVPPALGSDEWMLKQQWRAETEAQTWRELREESLSSQSLTRPAKGRMDYHHTGSTTLKALVRFGLATFGAHVAWLSAIAFQLGQFEVWLAMVAGFTITLSLSMFGAARWLVHLLAQAAGWMVFAAAAMSGAWLAFQFLR